MNVNQSVNVYVDKVSEFSPFPQPYSEQKLRSPFIIPLGSDEENSF